MLEHMSQRSSSKPLVGVVILGAGSSLRMGEPKLLLPWADTTVLGHLIRCWEKLEARQIAVVGAASAPGIQQELDRLGFPKNNRIFNPAPEQGMFSSICCAATWSGWQPELTHWIVTLGDQPHLRLETLQGLLNFGRGNFERICQPQRGGRRRHPVLLPKTEFEALKDSSASDLKQFLEQRTDALAGFESDDAGLDLDIDRPEDYERARQLAPPNSFGP